MKPKPTEPLTDAFIAARAALLHPHLRHLSRREIVNIARVTHLVAMQNATAARGA